MCTTSCLIPLESTDPQCDAELLVNYLYSLVDPQCDAELLVNYLYSLVQLT